MKEIKPTKQEVFADLRAQGCCWLVGMGKGCECYSQTLRQCYADAEKRLTRHEYTQEEIEERQKENAEAVKAIFDCLDEVFGGATSENN